MSYLGDLRKVVGHRPLLAVGATVIVMNHNSEILLYLRSDAKTWGFPGGAAKIVDWYLSNHHYQTPASIEQNSSTANTDC